MGFFQKIGDFFARNTRLDDSKRDQLVLVCKTPGQNYHINSKLIVPEGFVFAFCARNHVLDIIGPGTTIVSAPTLPQTTKRLKLYKLSAEGKPKKKFKAQGYQVLTEPCHDLICKTTERIPLYLGNVKTDWFKVHALFSVRVSIPATFLKMLFREYEVLRPGEGNKLTCNLASEVLTKYLQKANILPNQINSMLIEQSTELHDYFSMAMAKYGLEVLSFSLIKVQTKQVKNHLVQPAEQSSYNILGNETNNETQLKPFLSPLQPGEQTDEDMFMFGEQPAPVPETALQPTEQAQPEPLSERELLKQQIRKTVVSDGKFVDLTPSAGFEAPKKQEACPNCGEPIALSKVNFCPICGHPLVK